MLFRNFFESSVAFCSPEIAGVRALALLSSPCGKHCPRIRYGWHRSPGTAWPISWAGPDVFRQTRAEATWSWLWITLRCQRRADADEPLTSDMIAVIEGFGACYPTSALPTDTVRANAARSGGELQTSPWANPDGLSAPRRDPFPDPGACPLSVPVKPRSR